MQWRMARQKGEEMDFRVFFSSVFLAIFAWLILLVGLVLVKLVGLGLVGWLVFLFVPYFA